MYNKGFRTWHRADFANRQEGHVDTVKYLLSIGANIEVKDRENYTGMFVLFKVHGYFFVYNTYLALFVSILLTHLIHKFTGVKNR